MLSNCDVNKRGMTRNNTLVSICTPSESTGVAKVGTWGPCPPPPPPVDRRVKKKGGKKGKRGSEKKQTGGKGKEKKKMFP